MRRRRLMDREVVTRLLLVTASFAAALGLVELAVHAIEAYRGPMLPGGPTTARYHQDDPVIGRRHRPDVTQRYAWP